MLETKVGPIAFNTVPIGLYPRKAAKSAPEAGVWLKATAIVAGQPALLTAVASAEGKVAFNETIITAKNMPWLMVAPTF